MSETISPFRQVTALIGWVLLTFLAPLLGAFTPPGAWYQALQKPEWTPPAWLFAPVWTLLYLGMAMAAWLVWKKGMRSGALRWYIIQWALNAAWTPVFFGAHQIGLALLVMFCLWLAIVLTLRAFWQVSRSAGLLLVPYLLWVSFATLLNVTLWWLNP